MYNEMFFIDSILDFPTCGPEQFLCKNFRCIDRAQVCDGRDTCRDGNYTDEVGCPSTTCEPGMLRFFQENLCSFVYIFILCFKFQLLCILSILNYILLTKQFK